MALSLFGRAAKLNLSLTDHKLRKELEDPISPTLRRITRTTTISNKATQRKQITKGELQDNS
jgi:hypothetical protein